MNQIIKEECPYCENYVTGQMRDTMARKATRIATKQGITMSIKHGGNAMLYGAGDFLSNGVKIFAGNQLDKLGKYVESQVFEVGDFDFSCPHCRRYWQRNVPHNLGDVTLCIDHDYVNSFYNKELRGRMALMVLSIVVSALNIGLLVLCFNWCSNLSSTYMEHSDGLFGLGEGDYEAVNYMYYFAWLLFLGGLVSNYMSLNWIKEKYKAWKKLKNIDFKLFRFRLLTNQSFDEKISNTSGINIPALMVGLINVGLSVACGSYCYFNEATTIVPVEPSIWTLGQSTRLETHFLWYVMGFLALVFGVMALVFLVNITNKDNKKLIKI